MDTARESEIRDMEEDGRIYAKFKRQIEYGELMDDWAMRRGVPLAILAGIMLGIMII